MSNRTIRRAIERKALKLERKNLQAAAAGSTTSVAFLNQSEAPSEDPQDRITAEFAQRQAQRRAVNQANAQHSTGPITSEGRAASSKNALKHGLTGNTVLLDSDDAAEYQTRLDYYTGLYQPATFEERRLVQAIHDANWRLDRITNLESTIYAKGRIELEGCFGELPVAQRKSFIQLETSQRYAKDLRNLHIQEARIQRQRTKDLVALKQLQDERREAEADKNEAVEEAGKLPTLKTGGPLTTQPNGFEFSSFDSVPSASTHTPAQTLQPYLKAE